MPRRIEYVSYYATGGGDFPPSGYLVYNEKGPKLPITPLEALIWDWKRRGFSSEEAHFYAESGLREMTTPEKIVQRLRFKQAVEEATPELNELEHAILTLRFGLDGNIAVTQKRVGIELGLPRQQVGKIEHQALEKVRPHYFTIYAPK